MSSHSSHSANDGATQPVPLAPHPGSSHEAPARPNPEGLSAQALSFTVANGSVTGMSTAPNPNIPGDTGVTIPIPSGATFTVNADHSITETVTDTVKTDVRQFSPDATNAQMFHLISDSFTLANPTTSGPNRGTQGVSFTITNGVVTGMQEVHTPPAGGAAPVPGSGTGDDDTDTPNPIGGGAVVSGGPIASGNGAPVAPSHGHDDDSTSVIGGGAAISGNPIASRSGSPVKAGHGHEDDAPGAIGGGTVVSGGPIAGGNGAPVIPGHGHDDDAPAASGTSPIGGGSGGSTPPASPTPGKDVPLDPTAVFKIDSAHNTVSETTVHGNVVETKVFVGTGVSVASGLYALASDTEAFIQPGAAKTLLDVNPLDRLQFSVDTTGKILSFQAVNPDGTTGSAQATSSTIAFTKDAASGYIVETVTHGTQTSCEVYSDGNGDGIFTAIAHGTGTVDLVGLATQVIAAVHAVT